MLFGTNDVQKRFIPNLRQEQWNEWRRNISTEDYEAIARQINNYCNACSVFVSSHIPAKIWGNKLCRPLLEACYNNEENADFFFGLIVWQTLIERKDEWYFLLADKDGDEVLGTKYWRRTKQN